MPKPEETAVHTVKFLVNVGVLIEEKSDGGTLLWFDKDRAALLAAFANGGCALPAAANPDVRLRELKEARMRPVSPTPLAPAAPPAHAESGGLGETDAKGGTEGAAALEPTDVVRRYRWRLYLLPHETAAWMLLHGHMQMPSLGLAPQVAISLVDGALDPAFCAEWGVTSEQLRAFVDRCLLHGLVQRVEGLQDYEVLIANVDLEAFEPVEITDRPKAHFDADMMKLLEYVREEHREGRLAQRADAHGRMGPHLARWIQENFTSARVSAIEYARNKLRLITGSVKEKWISARGGILTYRSEHQDNLVCWPGFEGVELVSEEEVREDARQRRLAKANATAAVKPPPPPPPTLEELRVQLGAAQAELHVVEELVQTALAEADVVEAEGTPIVEELDRFLARVQELRVWVKEYKIRTEAAHKAIVDLECDRVNAQGRIEHLEAQIREGEAAALLLRRQAFEEAAKARRDALERELAEERAQLGIAD